MLKNYFKIAYRSLWKNKIFSCINIFGLSTGMACTFLLYLFIQDELSYDQFHQGAEDIFVVKTSYKTDHETNEFLYTAGAAAAAMKKDYPEVKYASRIRQTSGLLSVKDKRLPDESLIYTDKSFFDILPYRFLYGTAQEALQNPKSIVISRSLAKKLFGSVAKAYQKNVTFDESPLLISGIIEDVPENTVLPFDAVMPIEAIPLERRKDIGAEGWVGIGCQTVVRLQPNTDYQALNQKLPELRKYYKESAEKFGFEAAMSMVPVVNIRLYDYGEGSGGTITYVYILGALSILILLIAAANYMNLATARSTTRAKEVGIRKVVGSHRLQLMGQFLTEALVFTSVALTLSIFMVELVLPYFNNLTQKQLSIYTFLQPNTLTVILIVYIGLSLLSGVYPAFMLSNFNPVKVLKGKFSGNTQGILLRKSLVVFQFAISIIMICCTWLIFNQMQYIQQKDLGFNRDQIVIVGLNEDINRAKAATFRAQLLKDPNVQHATLTNVVPSYNSWSHNSYNYISDDGISRQLDLDDMPVGFDYLETLEMELIKGRDFSTSLNTDSNQVCIVNEALVRATGFKAPLGKTISSVYTNGRKLKIIGVVKDFHLFSLHNEVRPAMLFISRNPYNLVARVNPQNVKQTLAGMEKTWGEFTKKYPFEPKFLDVTFASRYEDDQRQGQVFMSFSILAILIACLGIFGLATFAMQQRRKEIGIRKVLGAGLADIILLVSREFSQLILIAIVIGLPIAYFFAQEWLQDFAYKIDLLSNWYIFLLTALVALVINFLTTGFQALRAATLNPVEVLKEE